MSYNEDSIKELGYPGGIQKKPGMYLGSKGINGNNHMVREVLDNSIDEALNGYGKCITVTISNKKGCCSVEDEGRGIPPKAIEKAFCTLHSSGKFDNNEYSASAGTHGVGTTAVNALSKSFIVQSIRDFESYTQKFSDGKPITKLTKTGRTKKKNGTIVYFEPNEKFMDTNQFDIDTIKSEMASKVYVLKNVKLILVNEDTKEKFEYFSKEGLTSYLKAHTKEPLCNPITMVQDMEFPEHTKDRPINYNVEIAFCYDNKSHTDITSFCNSLWMKEGGLHETTFRTTLTRFFKKYIKENNLIAKKDESLFAKINGDHVTDGLVAIISIKHPDPEFQNQTKQQVNNKQLAAISKPLTDTLEKFAANNAKEMKTICQKIIISVKAYEAARSAREKVQKKGENQFSIVSDLSKLANCISKDISINEIFITEGRSASGTAKEARDKTTQAIYSLRGKMLNTINMAEKDVLSNKECADLTYILTGNKFAIDKNFDISTLKYGKVIMLCDADTDGYHIAVLGMTYIFEHMKDIILHGHMYVAIPPLYSIIEKGKKRYFVDQNDYDNYLYKKILSYYGFVTEESKAINSIKKISNIFKKYDLLVDFIVNYANNNTGLDKDFLLNLFDFVDINGAQLNTIKKFINEECEDIIYNKKTSNCEGFYNGNYVYFTMVSLVRFINDVNQYIVDNDIPSNSIYFATADSEEYDLLTINEYSHIIKEMTPKSRVRLKG